MKILCTGADGFIGSAFVPMARASGHVVTCMNREWVDPVAAGIRWGDFDALVHLAAAGVRRAEGREWDECMEVNFHALVRLLRSINSPKLIVFLARSRREDGLNGDPALWDDAYYVTKKLGGLFAMTWCQHFPGPVIMPALESCYGPGEVEKVAGLILRDITGRAK